MFAYMNQIGQIRVFLSLNSSAVWFSRLTSLSLYVRTETLNENCAYDTF